MSDDIVTFLDSRGRVISNDPRFAARKLQEQVEAQQANLAGTEEVSTESETPEGSTEETPSPEEVTEEPQEPEDDGLDDLGGAELKELAQAEEVDIKGLKKVSQVREAIRAARAEAQED